MNAPRDPWADFADVFADELKAAQSWTPEMMEAAREAYEMEQIETARSEAAQDQLRSQYVARQR